MSKIKWKVSEPPTGRFRAFDRRSWPMGDNAQGNAIAMLRCEDEYKPANVKSGDHKPLQVWLAIKNKDPKKNGTWTWRKLQGEFKTLKEAKEAAEHFYCDHPNMFCS